MRQNFEIFKTICSSDFFHHASIVLFLNKYDIFCEKLKHASLTKCWESYEGQLFLESADDGDRYKAVALLSCTGRDLEQTSLHASNKLVFFFCRCGILKAAGVGAPARALLQKRDYLYQQRGQDRSCQKRRLYKQGLQQVGLFAMKPIHEDPRFEILKR